MEMSYESPSIVDHGHLVDLTAGSQDGDYTDANFPVNTPRNEVTFS